MQENSGSNSYLKAFKPVDVDFAGGAVSGLHGIFTVTTC